MENEKDLGQIKKLGRYKRGKIYEEDLGLFDLDLDNGKDMDKTLNGDEVGKLIEIDQYQYRKRCEEGIGLVNSKENIRRSFKSDSITKLNLRKGNILEFPTK